MAIERRGKKGGFMPRNVFDMPDREDGEQRDRLECPVAYLPDPVEFATWSRGGVSAIPPQGHRRKLQEVEKWYGAKIAAEIRQDPGLAAFDPEDE